MTTRRQHAARYHRWGSTQLHRVALAAALAAGAVSAAPQEKPAFPSSSRLVQVTVSVTNERGEGVDNLRASEFTVRDEGVAHPLTYFQAPTTVGRKPADLAIQQLGEIWLGRAGPANAHDGQEAVGAVHYLLIVFEPMQVDARQRAIRAVTRFLRRRDAWRDYAIGLIDGPRLVQRFLTDRAQTLRKLDELRGRAYGPARIAPLNDWSGAALAAVQELAALPGRKSMVVFVDFDTPTSHLLSPEAAIRANIVLYPVDARGLVGVVPFGEAEHAGIGSVATSEAAPQIAADIMDRTSILGQQAVYLRSVAEATGGRALTGDNDLGKIFRRMEENSRGVYVLGYDLTAAMADGRFHRVEVKVSRQRLNVRAKEGYFAPQR
jgi:VWFA-related protein